MLAALVLVIHLLVIAFNLAGMVVVPLGARRGWIFVHAPAWRLAHVASLTATALQATYGKACFLTIWQAALSEKGANPQPLIMEWVNSMILWPLPAGAFIVIYLLALAYVVGLLWLVPLRWHKGR